MGSEVKLRIVPKFSKEDFMRKVWTTLAEEDAPLALFTKDFDEVTTEEYEVLIDTISADVSYHASIGYDRQEPYIAYEKYYEEEPYIDYERYYDVNTKSYRNRQVTKYKKVAKERPVTKYKTVTDWSTFSDSREVNNTTAYATNKNYSDFDMDIFRKAYAQLTNSEFATISGTEAMMFKISSAANKKVEKKHSNAIQRSAANSLPGDRYRDLNCTYSVVDQSSELCKVPLYRTSIEYDGKKYTKYAFPFGNEMIICGDQIINNESFETIKRRTNDELNKRIIRRRCQAEDNVWKKTCVVEILTVLLLLASIVMSLLSIILKSSIMHNMIYIIIAFAAATAFFAFNFIFDKIINVKEDSKAESDIRNDKNETDNKLDNFKKNHNDELQTALNRKLKTLFNSEHATKSE